MEEVAPGAGSPRSRPSRRPRSRFQARTPRDRAAAPARGSPRSAAGSRSARRPSGSFADGPRARSARRPRRPRARRSPAPGPAPGARHSAAPGEWRPAGSIKARQPGVPGESEMPLQIDRERARPARGRRPGPSTALLGVEPVAALERPSPSLEVGRQRGAIPLVEPGPAAAPDEPAPERAGDVRIAPLPLDSPRDRSWPQPFPRLGPVVPVDPDADARARLVVGELGHRGRRVGEDGPERRGPPARRRQLVGADDDVGQAAGR